MRSREETRVWRGPVGWSLALHLLIGLSLLLSLERDQPIDTGADEAPGPVIQATSIDARELDAAHEARAEQERRREEAAREAQREAERRAREQEEARQAAEAQRQREEREAERQRQQALERERAEQEERRRQEAEEQRRREEEEARRRAEAEAERRRQEELERQRAEEERRQREAEEAMQQAAEEEERRRQAAARQRQQASLQAQYSNQLRAHVERHWYRPADVPDDLACEVVAHVIPGGEVVDVRIRRCNAPDSVARTIESAVYRASPMPPPPDELEFSREIYFTFRGESR